MRLTEYIDLITHEKLPDVEDVTYSHLEYRDEDGKLLEKYRKDRRLNKKKVLVDKYNNCFIKSITFILINMLKRDQTLKKIVKYLFLA